MTSMNYLLALEALQKEAEVYTALEAVGRDKTIITKVRRDEVSLLLPRRLVV